MDALTALFSILTGNFKTKLVVLLECLQTLKKQCTNICFLVLLPVRHRSYSSYTLRSHFNIIIIPNQNIIFAYYPCTTLSAVQQ